MRRTVFWTGMAGTGWILGGYPAALAALPSRPWRREPGEPRVTIIVPAFREHGPLEAKLRGLRRLDYPWECIQVIVAVDEDEELAALAQRTLPEATVTFSPTRAGKAAALRRALELADGDIVVLTDANNVLEPESIEAAVEHFADPTVLGVAGRRGEVRSAYDRYEDLLRRLESRSGNVAAMSGEFMAVRREALPPFPEGIVNDDLWLLCHLVRVGGRVVYEPRAASVEDALDAGAEVQRRSRIGAGRAMLVGELRDLPPAFAIRLLSHKFGRLVLPFLLLQVLVASALLARQPGYRLALAAQLALYGAGAAEVAGLAPAGPAGRMAGIAGQFTVGNVATAIGVVRAARRRQTVTWEPVR